MTAYAVDDLKTRKTPQVQVDLDRVANIGPDEVSYYLDVARRMRAAVIADLFRTATQTVARVLHLNPASRGATPRAV